jgi:ABC-type multidrug transport system fused ATPase/permease subunit
MNNYSAPEYGTMRLMSVFRQRVKRVAADAAGYGLILLGIASGWLPGPGGIPLVLAGLGLLSINNEWAARFRKFIFKHSGRLRQILFPRQPVAQWAYDIFTVLLLILVAILAWNHNAIWQISLGIFLFFLSLLIAGYNRDRLVRLRHKDKT